jgi:hypothetical protein
MAAAFLFQRLTEFVHLRKAPFVRAEHGNARSAIERLLNALVFAAQYDVGYRFREFSSVSSETGVVE